MGLFQNLFFKTWLVEASVSVGVVADHLEIVNKVLQATTADDACARFSAYLVSEGYVVADVVARFG